jgi:hypothetical protein
MKRPLLWKALSALAGGAGGFAYYYYIGCRSGSCPITGSPWISTLYGGVLALALFSLLYSSTRKEPQR